MTKRGVELTVIAGGLPAVTAVLAAEAAPAVFEAPPVALHLGVAEVRVVALAVVVAGAEAGLEHTGHSLHQEEGGQRGHQKGPQQRRVAGCHRACRLSDRVDWLGWA